MPRPLKPPEIDVQADGSRELSWVLPYSVWIVEAFEELLAVEADLEAKVCGGTGREIRLVVSYPEDKMNRVMFACYLLHQAYQRVAACERAIETPCHAHC